MRLNDEVVAINTARQFSALLKRLTVARLFDYARECGLQISERKKKDLIQFIIDHHKCRLTYAETARLSIIHDSSNVARYSWQAFMLTHLASDPSLMLANTLQFRLRSQLASYFPCYTSVHTISYRLWIRVSLPSTSSVFTTIYIVISPQSPVILSTFVRHSLRPFVMQALQSVLCCGSIVPMPLQGKSFHTLRTLIDKRESLGALDSFVDGLHANPLTSRVAPTTTITTTTTTAALMSKHKPLLIVANENAIVEQHTNKTCKSLWGSKKLPSLQQVLYRSKQSIDVSETRTIPIRMIVRFRGLNVIEGMKELVEQGITSKDLPVYMHNLQAMASSDITIHQPIKS